MGTADADADGVAAEAPTGCGEMGAGAVVDQVVVGAGAALGALAVELAGTGVFGGTAGATATGAGVAVAAGPGCGAGAARGGNLSAGVIEPLGSVGAKNGVLEHAARPTARPADHIAWRM